MIILIVGTIIGIVVVMRYGEKVKKDPTKSLIYDDQVFALIGAVGTPTSMATAQPRSTDCTAAAY